MRIGLRVPQYAAGWQGCRDAALHAEDLGFAHLWVNDHFRTPGRDSLAPALDALTTLAALAPLTSRARLGVAVLSASYRAPAVTAKLATVLDVVSEGRMIVGLGAGSDRREHAAYGIPFGDPSERTEGVRRTLAALRAMAAAPGGATVPGVADDAPNLPPAIQPGGPPVWVAAHRTGLLRLAGAEADGIVAAFLEPGELERRVAVARAARPETLRPLDVALYTYVMPVPSEAEAHAWLADEARALGTTPARLLRWLRGTGIVGSPSEVRDALAAHGAAGATDAILVLPNRAPGEAIDALAEAVLPPRGGAAPAVPRSARPEHNLAQMLVVRHREAGAGGAPAVEDEDGAWSYDDLGAAAATAAGALLARGVRRGDRVLIALRDGRAWCAGFIGAALLGAVPVPYDPFADPGRLAGICDDCEPALVLREEDGPVPPGRWALAADLEDGPPRPPAAVHPSDLAYLVYSSGSTGRPKAVVHGHGDLAVSIDGYSRAVLGLGPGERSHSVARAFTSLGFGNGFFRPLGTGACAVMTRTRPTVRTVAGAVAERGVTVLTGVPTFWLQLAEFLDRRPGAWSAPALRLAVSSGDSLPPSVGARVTGALGVPLIEGFGCSECSNVVLSTRPGEPLRGLLGAVTPGVEVRLGDDDGGPVAPGEPGRLWIRSDSTTSGYWRRRDDTRSLVHGEWLRMADVLVEEDGSYRHVGRADDLFKVDARWVSPTRVEAALLDHPSVAEAAVVGLPDADGLMRPAAFVVTAGDAGDPARLERDLRAHVARVLEPHSAPARVTVLDALPRLPGGKLDRRALRSR